MFHLSWIWPCTPRLHDVPVTWLLGSQDDSPQLDQSLPWKQSAPHQPLLLWVSPYASPRLTSWQTFVQTDGCMERNNLAEWPLSQKLSQLFFPCSMGRNEVRNKHIGGKHGWLKGANGDWRLVEWKRLKFMHTCDQVMYALLIYSQPIWTAYILLHIMRLVKALCAARIHET